MALQAAVEFDFPLTRSYTRPLFAETRAAPRRAHHPAKKFLGLTWAYFKERL